MSSPSAPEESVVARHGALRVTRSDDGFELCVGERRWRLDSNSELALSYGGIGAAVGDVPVSVELRPVGAERGQLIVSSIDDDELERLEQVLRRAAEVSGCGFVDLEAARRRRDDAAAARQTHFASLLQGLARTGGDATSLAVLPFEFGNGCALRTSDGELWLIEANGYGLANLDAFFDSAQVDTVDRLIRCTTDARVTRMVEALRSRVRQVHSLDDAPVERLLVTPSAHVFRLRTTDARVTFAARVSAAQWHPLTGPALKTDVLWTSHERGVHDLPLETLAALKPLMVVVSGLNEPMGAPAELVTAQLKGSAWSVHDAQTLSVGVAGGACGWRIIDG